MFSVIIPVLNEKTHISRCIKGVLSQKEDIEIILADGGSIDGTLLEASQYDIKSIRLDKPNMAIQINKAVEISKNDVLIILHADCILAADSLQAIEDHFTKYPNSVGGAFTMALEGKRFVYKILSMGGNIFCRLFKIYFGDRAMFVKKQAFERIGGFRDLPIMSDVDFSIRMKKLGKTALLKGPVLSSSRKFENEFFLRTIYLMFWSLIAFKRGLPLETIKDRYYRNYQRKG